MKQLVMFNDDSLVIHYQDGSILELSPCGTSFIHTQDGTPSSQKHPLSMPDVVHQRTRFAISAYHHKIQEALKFRNQFAEHPYICEEILSSEDLHIIHGKITNCLWPPKEEAKNYINSTEDGSMMIQSVDSYCNIIVPVHQQTFTASFLTAINTSTTTNCDGKSKDSQVDNSARDQLAYTEDPPKPGYSYGWVTQTHCITMPNPCWQYPLSILLGDKLVMNNKENLNENKVIGAVPMKLPRSLPVTCVSAHAHQWKTKNAPAFFDGDKFLCQRDFKVVWREGITYRVCLQGDNPHFLEIFPGDRSILLPQSKAGHFFTHWKILDETSTQACTKIEKTLYAVKNAPPLLRDTDYSIAKILRRGQSILHCDAAVKLQSETLSLVKTKCCWQMTKQQSLVLTSSNPGQVKECHLPNIGQFTLLGKSTVHVKFADRTILNFTLTSQQIYLISQTPQNAIKILGNECFCTVIASNGAHMTVCLGDPREYEWYISVSWEFAVWAVNPSDQRQAFYQGTIWDPLQKDMLEHGITPIGIASSPHEDQHAPSLSWTRHQGKETSPADQASLVPGNIQPVVLPGNYPQPDAYLGLNLQRYGFHLIQDTLLQTSKKIEEINSFLSK